MADFADSGDGGSSFAWVLAGPGKGWVLLLTGPLAGRLLGLKAGDSFKLPNSSLGQVLTVE